MQSASLTDSRDTQKVTDASSTELVNLVRSQAQTIVELKHQLEWFKRQIFGNKSERFAPQPDPTQMHLGEVLLVPSALPDVRQSVPGHTRRVPQRDAANTAEALPFFDESRVPVETITVIDAAMKQLDAAQFEVIGEKVSYRLAQRPGSYIVLKYVRPLIKILATQALHCSPAPVGVLEGSRAEVSFAAGLLVDKFAYHLPLYRQHRRLEDQGIKVSRPWLTQIAQRTIGLLEPIYEAQFASIRSSRVKAMDETPIKVGRAGLGKTTLRNPRGGMKTGYFWPIYGEADEICFPFFPTRSHEHVLKLLGMQPAADAVLITDGYGAYQRYAQKTGITHAQCWAHCRRGFFEALQADPTGAAEALEQIKAIYAIEADIREKNLSGDDKRLHRLTHVSGNQPACLITQADRASQSASDCPRSAASRAAA